MKNFRTYDLAIEFYNDCKLLRLKAPMKDQFDRASLSIVLNLAEGSGKPTTKDRAKFYAIALGSLREVQALLQLTKSKQLAEKANVLGACVYKLARNPGGV